jgi:hypothetical protein
VLGIHLLDDDSTATRCAFEYHDDVSRVLFTELQPGGGTGQFAYLRPTDGSPAIRLGEGGALALSPDGKWALALMSSSTRLVALPTGAGEPRDLTRVGFDYAIGVGPLFRTATWFPTAVTFSSVRCRTKGRYSDTVEPGWPIADLPARRRTRQRGDLDPVS